MSYRCSVCGEIHEGAPTGWDWKVPDLLAGVPDDELAERHWLVVDELCTGEDDAGEPFFAVKGNVEIPVLDEGEPLVWTVWGSLSERTAHRALDHWVDERRVEDEPTGGYLLNGIPVYEPSTVNLRIGVLWRPVGVRPALVVDEDHPLAREQREGVPRARLDEIGHELEELGLV